VADKDVTGLDPANPAPPTSPERRGALATLVAGFAALLGLVGAAGPLAVLLDPLIRATRKTSKGEQWLSLGPVSMFPEGGPPVRVPISMERRDAWQTLPTSSVGFVYVQRTAPAECRVLSGVCPHMGCAVVLADEDRSFQCPCHRSTFDIDGATSTAADGRTNPSPRAMDPLPWRLEGGQVQVQWIRYETGTPDRVARG
jgi:menaquinol-cytochrome c reductase iron-sulfur subunit